MDTGAEKSSPRSNHSAPGCQRLAPRFDGARRELGLRRVHPRRTLSWNRAACGAAGRPTRSRSGLVRELRVPASDRASASPPGFAGERSTPATLTQNSGADASIRAARSRGTRGIAGRPTWAARGSEVRSPAREWSTAIQLQGRALFSWRREKYPFADGLKNLSDPKLFGGADQLVRAGADTPVPRLPTRRPRATGHAHSV